jgi:two-component system OmpR family sensor kinase
MASIRARLTTGYAAVLLATFAALGLALYAVRRGADERALQRQVAGDADFALRIVRQAAATGEPVTVTADPLIGPVVAPRLRSLLEGVPDYVVVLDSTGRTLYSSFAVRQLDADDQVVLSRAALQLPPNGTPQRFALSDRDLLVAARPEYDRATGIARVVAGAEVGSVGPAPRDVLSTVLLVAPIVIVLSVAGAYVVAGRAFRPLDSVVNEVEAITDGRSLHRRLPLPAAGDELMRLGTTLNAMLDRLETSFGALRRFTADASHELKTPLTVLRADLERAMSAPPQSTEQLIALEEALVETRRMSDLVDSLLTLARADEGRFEVHREPVALEPIVRDVYEAGVILGEDAGISVSLPVLEDATVLGDEPRLRQLFMNLVMNAIKYTSRGGHIDITLSHRLDTVTFTVKDTGIGIAGVDLPYIFDRFWRADRVRSRASGGGGFGLGLAISQWIAHAHGGAITVTSRLGRGSVFTVNLPLPSTEQTPLQPPSPALAASP